MEKTLILIKPDGVSRGLCGKVLNRFEEKGMKISAMKMLTLTREKAEAHYSVHKDKPFFPPLIDFITSGPIVAAVIESPSAISLTRSMAGATSPSDAHPGTIRGDYGLITSRNIIHASDSPENAEKEIALFFEAEEIQQYTLPSEVWSGY